MLNLIKRISLPLNEWDFAYIKINKITLHFIIKSSLSELNNLFLKALRKKKKLNLKNLYTHFLLWKKH